MYVYVCGSPNAALPPQSILSSLSATLRTRVVFEAHADLIRGLHFFRDTDRTIAAALVVQLKPLIVPARSALANAVRAYTSGPEQGPAAPRSTHPTRAGRHGP